MTSLVALEKRLASAGEGSRELDVEIHEQIGGGYTAPLTEEEKQHIAANCDPTWNEWQNYHYPRFDVPLYTSSIDAALALVSRMLPDWAWSVSGEDGVSGPWANVWPNW